MMRLTGLVTPGNAVAAEEEGESMSGRRAVTPMMSDAATTWVRGRSLEKGNLLYLQADKDVAYKAQARAVKEHRQAQAVILPLEFAFPWNRRL